jgi:hypothetical protein
MTAYSVFMTVVAIMFGGLCALAIYERNKERARRGMVPWYLPDGKYRLLDVVECEGTTTALMVGKDGCRWSTDWTGGAGVGDTVEYSYGAIRIVSSLAPPFEVAEKA